MKNRRKIRTFWGGFMEILAIAILVSMWITSHLLTRPDYFAKQVQNSVWKVEKEIEDMVASNSDIGEYEKNSLGLMIFHKDSLLLWNDNTVTPRILRRRVGPDTDTICNLLSGDYYVKSVRKGQMTYYIFCLLNTTYKLENRYFENRFVLSHPFINNKIEFGNNQGYEIVTRNGKLLSHCKIEQIKRLRFPYKEIILSIEGLLFLAGLVLLKDKKSHVKKENNKFKVEYGIALIVVLAILLTYFYNRKSIRKENAEMIKTAEILSVKRDMKFENSFAGFMELVKTDTEFRDMVFSESNVLAEVILGYSEELLFDENMKAYHATLAICDSYEEITIQPEGYVINCDDYFLEKLANNDQKRVGDGLYFIDYYTLDPNYLGKIKLFSADSLQEKTLYFEFYKPIAPEGFSFPQLLQETNSMKPYDYSVAHYRNNILVYKYGKYIYSNFLNEQNYKDLNFTYTDGYKHYTRFDDNKVLIISTPRKGWSEITAPFALFLLGLLIPYLCIYWMITPRQPRKNRSFRHRLQNVVFFTLAISFLAIGPVSVIYMRSLYDQKTATMQFETTRTIAADMSNDYDVREWIGKASPDITTEILQHYAGIFFSDLNLYSLDGKLLATTRPEIVDLNLQAPLMNAEAYQNMHNNKALYFTHEEKLGKGIYQSNYIPLNDSNGNALAYLNTPYFSSATELHNEIRNFVLTYINIILILLTIALILVIHITNRLTQPLSLIQNKLGNIKIDRKNEPIEWKGHDEIGALVKQYNILIEELEKSATELRRTATESAWRGVARQVAHEIKNSLTPMRLSVQMLQRNIENGKATPEQTQRIANTLIEQIDALSDISSSFSRYAKLPENHLQPLDLAELIDNVVNLYDNVENISFNYHYNPTANHTYNGDKTNLNSAFGNLIKNATQAIGNQVNGHIDVKLQSTETQFIISIKDNGKGIKEEDKSQIFLPNFTTKTGGSGVGLSLTYNIILSAGGTITFDSKEGEGTVFVVELPKNSVSLPPETK